MSAFRNAFGWLFVCMMCRVIVGRKVDISIHDMLLTKRLRSVLHKTLIIQ